MASVIFDDKGAGRAARGGAPLVLTMGDPAGVGPDVAVTAWAHRRREAVPAFLVAGDADLLAARAETLGLDVPVARVATPAEGGQAFAEALGVLHESLPCAVAPGQPAAGAAPAVIAAVERAVGLVMTGTASALVTGPVNKKLLYDAGLPHPGHTEFLGALARAAGKPASPLMMLVCDELKVVPATIHIPLKDVPAALTTDLIAEVIAGTARGLARFFGIARPRLAIAGLNPHAGEGGALGREEIELIAPAIAEARAAGVAVTGPLSADTLFSAPLRATYDAAIAMYHDQALIPIKTLAFDTAVNLTLGLPFIRTSPDHGTAYDLAGTGRASASSLIAALKLADLIAARHQAPAA